MPRWRARWWALTWRLSGTDRGEKQHASHSLSSNFKPNLFNCIDTATPERCSIKRFSCQATAALYNRLRYNTEEAVQADGGIEPDWTDYDGFVRWAGEPYEIPEDDLDGFLEDAEFNEVAELQAWMQQQQQQQQQLAEPEASSRCPFCGNDYTDHDINSLREGSQHTV